MKGKQSDSDYTNIHQDLIDRSLEGDRSAQRSLYEAYSKAMYNTSLRITKDEYDAQDVLQESFISAFRNLNSYKGDSTFGAWLKRIVINKAINVVKKRRMEFSELDEELHDMGEESVNFDSLEEGTTVQKVKEAMMALPEGYRMVFSLYLLEGYDHKEISQILDITESTSKSQFNRAKKKLRDILNEEKQ